MTEKNQIYFVTKNQIIMLVAQHALRDSDIELIQLPEDTIEIQHSQVEEIAKYSTK